MSALQARTHTAAATRAVAKALAGVLRAGDLLVLDGPLGAGKTTFTQGLGEGLGVRGAVASPTFVIARVHPSLDQGPELVHVDAYRLGEAWDIEDLDLDADLDHAVTVVEWGRDRVEHLASSHLLIELQRPDEPVPALATGDNAEDDAGGLEEPRLLTVRARGERWDAEAFNALRCTLQAHADDVQEIEDGEN